MVSFLFTRDRNAIAVHSAVGQRLRSGELGLGAEASREVDRVEGNGGLEGERHRDE